MKCPQGDKPVCCKLHAEFEHENYHGEKKNE